MTVKTTLRELIEMLVEEEAREVLEYTRWLLSERERATELKKNSKRLQAVHPF